MGFFYAATNALDTDWKVVAARYADLFDLDMRNFSPIASERWGYAGTLTLFDPARRLDRIELSQTIADEKDTLHEHPKNLHGMLLGISRPGFAWTWSGQPARVSPHAATTPD